MSQKINSAKTSTSNVPGFAPGQRFPHTSVGGNGKRELMSSNVPTTTSSSNKTSPRNTGGMNNNKATPSTQGVPPEWMAAAEATVGRSSNISGTSPAFEYPDFSPSGSQRGASAYGHGKPPSPKNAGAAFGAPLPPKNKYQGSGINDKRVQVPSVPSSTAGRSPGASLNAQAANGNQPLTFGNISLGGGGSSSVAETETSKYKELVQIQTQLGGGATS